MKWFALLAAVGVNLAVTADARADVILWNDEQVTVSSAITDTLILYDESRAFVVPGGSVPSLYAYNSGTLNVLGGSVGWPPHAYNSSRVTMSDGTISSLHAYDSSTVDVSGGTISGYLRGYTSSAVDISGGSVEHVELDDASRVSISGGATFTLTAYDSNAVEMSGGSVGLLQILGDTTLDIWGGRIDNGLHSYSSSVVTFTVKDFRLGGGLALDGDRLLGTGILSGQWADGTERWAIDIATNDGAGIFVSVVGTADANGDGVVDDADASILGAYWQTSTGATWRHGDFNA
ncbi:MAG: hypothetical protein NTW96_03340 [Planctomycetia bacterium]|nr:hypothetical protein [Planctomycetia bacterium]